MQLPLLERLAQRLARSQHLLLADELIERARPHAVGERPQRIVRRRVAQQVRLQSGTRAARGSLRGRRCPSSRAANSGQRASPSRASSSPSAAPTQFAMHIACIAFAAHVHGVLREFDRGAEQQQEREDLPPARPRHQAREVDSQRAVTDEVAHACR